MLARSIARRAGIGGDVRALAGLRRLPSPALVLQPLSAPQTPQQRPNPMQGHRSLSTLPLVEPLISVAADAQTVLGYTPSPELVKFLSVAPPILLQFVFFSPLPAVKSFRDTGTTGDVSIMP